MVLECKQHMFGSGVCFGSTMWGARSTFGSTLVDPINSS